MGNPTRKRPESATAYTGERLAVTLKECTLHKFCVFCGQKPESKNKEHIIPRWLIEMTGDPNRQINLGVDTRHMRKTGEGKLLTFSFNSFQFPACSKCNSEFSALENVVKSYFERLFKNDYFTNFELDTLLDWFDKVRIGLWLGSITLDEFTDLIDPKFHIKKRISHRDRCLFVYEMQQSEWRGIQFIGFNSPGFQFVPSCFSLRVNNLYFFNYSYDFLFSENIGFPYPKLFRPNSENTRMFELELEKGKGKITLPLINQKFIKASTYIYQPIIPKEIYGTDGEEYYSSNQYVLNNCLNYQKGKGDIFYFEKGIHKLDEDSELLLTGIMTYDNESFPNRIARQTFLTLENLLKLKPYKEMDDIEKSQGFEENRLKILKAHRAMSDLLNKGYS